jgi:ubiquinone/menaquinone biosynthesis C-methylase UbiE
MAEDNLVLDEGVIRSVMLPQAGHWRNPRFVDACRRLGMDALVTGRLWEYAVVSLMMEALPNAKRCVALGVGVGREPVIGVAEDVFGRVSATDRWSSEWAIALKDVPAAEARRVIADALRLPIRDRSIDVLWSVSSIEHFHQNPAPLARIGRGIKRAAGALGAPIPWRRDAALKALIETERVLKRDGVAIISTELVIAGRTPSEFFGFYEFLDLMARARLRLASDRCVLGLDGYFLRHVLKLREVRSWSDPTPHIYLESRGTVFTPVVFVIAPSPRVSAE